MSGALLRPPPKKTRIPIVVSIGIAIALVLSMLGTAPSYAASSDNTALYKYQIYTGTNQQRAANGKSSLAASQRLNDIAQAWADHLAATSEWKHNPNVFTQVRSVGSWSLVGENLAAGYADGTAAVTGWMNSSGHKANILGNYNRIGIGVAFGGQYGVYYVQVFGNVTSSAGSETADIYKNPDAGNNPEANMDSVKVNSNGTITLSGWAFDRDAKPENTEVHVYIDGQGYNIGTTSKARADVKRVKGINSSTTGFSWTSSKLSKGNHKISVAVINKAGGSNVWFWSGTKTV